MAGNKEGEPGGETREKMTALYSQANLRGAAYREFSASRANTRARFRLMQRRNAEPSRRIAETTIPTEAAPKTEGGGVPAASPVAAAQERRAPESPEELPFGPVPQWLDPNPQWRNPQWSNQSTAGQSAAGQSAAGQSAAATNVPSGGETLLRAKERVASRWFALKGLFPQSPPAVERSSEREEERERRVPVFAVFSFAGGVGKTSLIATLGRALASHGERVLLAETSRFGLLPFYFGARDLKPGVVRTFAPPNNSMDVPVDVVTLDMEALQTESGGPDRVIPDRVIEDRLIPELLLDGERSHRILVDVQTGAEAIMRRLVPLAPTVVVPLLPEMSSVVSVRAIESVFSTLQPRAEQKIEPMYLLNQFDPSLPLHVDLREVLQEQLGLRLLPFVMHPSPAISEALAEGMTVVDYAPKSPVAQSYLRLADWLRSISEPAADYRRVRWSER